MEGWRWWEEVEEVVNTIGADCGVEGFGEGCGVQTADCSSGVRPTGAERWDAPEL